MLNNNCLGLCNSGNFSQEYHASKNNKNSFKHGFKRCRMCEVFMKHDGYRCPCCQGRLATKPRNAKSKRLLNNDIGIKRY